MTIPYNNYINISPNEFDKPIYRVMSVEQLLYMVESKKLTLRRPNLWDDPFENILLRAVMQVDGLGIVGFSGVMKCFYGQCWTLEKESDAMWRIYAPCKQGVKIKTTIRKLLAAIYDRDNINSDRKYFIGKVLYGDQAEIVKILLEDLSFDLITDHTFQSQTLFLLVKREAFAHEKEIRLIYRSDSELQEDEQKFLVKPSELINEIMFDPRMEQNQFEYYSRIVKNLGYMGKVNKSTLYDLPTIIKRQNVSA